ncbi:cytochrome P450 [Coprinellus micaceus]|uniref:Cytochrome P450 n=1 Tax=Coprinellus micaceus TaxID=71717 RepID=A0A4Y7TMY3_COPMI|nr:cytochrome P450 [Coprinellus micaceus]
MASTYVAYVEISLVLLVLFILVRFIRAKPTAQLPPGPGGYPLIGNLLDMPTEQEWLTFAQWGETWGDICSVTVLGQPLVILNSAKAAFEMLDKKSAIYSDRPVLQMGGELVGWKNTLVMLPYGDRFRRFRRFFHQMIGSSSAIRKFLPITEQEVQRFLRRVLTKPEDLSNHIRRSVGAVVLKVSYGYEVKDNHDPFITLADKATEQFSLATAPGGFLVDLIPALKHIPMWFPGAGFRRTADAWSRTLVQMVDQPFSFVKQQMATGIAPPSFTSAFLERKDLSPEEEFDLKWSSASLYSGAADTTVSALYGFFLAMALNPQVAIKAQTELDAVVGTDRLPSFDDREYLPYVNALAKEVFRWNTVVPTAVPHRAIQNDIHDGHYIPKGSLVIPNIWLMTHDPRTYKNPMKFNPDRFLAGGEPDPTDICFGFGRRTCPGSHLADSTVFIMCATVLSVFNISKCVVNGVVVEPVHEMTTGTISHPKPFQCSIKPRSEKSVVLIQPEA